jgi:hypothetical protein
MDFEKYHVNLHVAYDPQATLNQIALAKFALGFFIVRL